MTASPPSAGKEPSAPVRLGSGRLHYTTALGTQYSRDSRDLLGELPPDSVDLYVTSPLLRPKEYGNADQEAYVDWLLPFAQAALGVRRLRTYDTAASPG